MTRRLSVSDSLSADFRARLWVPEPRAPGRVRMIRWRSPTVTGGAASARIGKNMELVPESFVVPESLELQSFRIFGNLHSQTQNSTTKR